MKTTKALFCTTMLALGPLAGTDNAGAADVTGDRAKIGFNHVLTGNWATIAGGNSNTNKTYASTIGGGAANMIETNFNDYATISGGVENIIFEESYYSVIAGGARNQIGNDAHRSSIGGGDSNFILHDSYAAWIGGGVQHVIDTNSAYASIGGGGGNWIKTNAAYATIGGGWSNIIGHSSGVATIGGGWRNIILESADYAVIAGGRTSIIESNGAFGVILGGADNVIKADSSFNTISGGYGNTTTNHFSTVGGGDYNSATGLNATVPGGHLNTASATYTTVGGGGYNTATGYGSTVPGGGANTAAGGGSFAAGWRAKANHDGALVWGDYTDADIASTNAHSVTMRSGGGYRLFSNSGASQGVYLAPGGGSWTTMSDRNAKENVAAVNKRAVLEKVAALPVSTWNYKTQADEVRHIGPMAQDFKAAFGVGDSDTGITSIDADGVALAAIQGLYEMLLEKDSQLKELQKELKAIKADVAK